MRSTQLAATPVAAAKQLTVTVVVPGGAATSWTADGVNTHQLCENVPPLALGVSTTLVFDPIPVMAPSVLVDPVASVPWLTLVGVSGDSHTVVIVLASPLNFNPPNVPLLPSFWNVTEDAAALSKSNIEFCCRTLIA